MKGCNKDNRRKIGTRIRAPRKGVSKYQITIPADLADNEYRIRIILKCKQSVIHLHLIKSFDMNTAVATKKQTAFRLDGELLERLKVKARRENRSLNNYVERVLMAVAYDEPNEITIAAMKEAMKGKGEALDLSKWDEFIASL